jgi:hypothetical protein
MPQLPPLPSGSGQRSAVHAVHTAGLPEELAQRLGEGW